MATLVPTTARADSSCTNGSNLLTDLGCAASQGVANAAGSVAQSAAQQAEQALTQWVVDTAVWLLNQLADVILHSSAPDLGAGWWRAHYADMVAVAWVVAPVFLLLGIVQAVMRADLAVFGRVLSQLLLVALLTTGVVGLTQMLIGVIDQLSEFVARNSQADLQHFLKDLMAQVMQQAMAGAATNPTNPVGGASLPLAFLFLAGLLTTVAGVLIWLELLARTLVIYAALLFFPILLAAAIWPQVASVLRAFAEVLVAVIVSKFIVVVIVVAGVAALSATGQQGQGPSLLVGSGLLLLAAWAPWKFYRLLPFMEAGIQHHFGSPFQNGWDRWRMQRQAQAHGWARNQFRRSHGTHQMPIAGRAGKAAGAAKAGARTAAAGPAAPVVAAAQVAKAGVKVAGRRAAAGGGVPARPSQPAGAGGPVGWRSVKVARSGQLLVPGSADRHARRSGPPPAGAGS